MKAMAEYMGISASHLSGIEYGEKRLSSKHIESATQFFVKNNASTEQISELQLSAEQSKDIVHTGHLAPDARGLVAAFARRLQDGDAPTPEIINWLASKSKERDR
ncbi:hypothetical protein [Lysobacter gummosus]